jgi:hypothetical protein
MSKIAPAYVKAWATVQNMFKSGEVDGKYRYLEHDKIVDQLKAILPRFELCCIQSPGKMEGDLVSLETMVLHSSAQFIEGTATFPMMGIITTRDGRAVISGAQAAGGGLSFIRRQALCAFWGIVGDKDSDANVDWGKRADTPALLKSEMEILTQWQRVIDRASDMDELKTVYIDFFKMAKEKALSHELRMLVEVAKDIKKEELENPGGIAV